jgi:hypothetical protein
VRTECKENRAKSGGARRACADLAVLETRNLWIAPMMRESALDDLELAPKAISNQEMV